MTSALWLHHCFRTVQTTALSSPRPTLTTNAAGSTWSVPSSELLVPGRWTGTHRDSQLRLFFSRMLVTSEHRRAELSHDPQYLRLSGPFAGPAVHLKPNRS